MKSRWAWPCAFAGELPLPLDTTLAEQLVGPSPIRRRDSLGAVPALFWARAARPAPRGTEGRRRPWTWRLAHLRYRRVRVPRSKRSGMSHRQELSRVFRERVGLGPKSLIRLGRFQRALRVARGAGTALGGPRWRCGPATTTRRTSPGTSGCSRGRGRSRYLREAREIARTLHRGCRGGWVAVPSVVCVIGTVESPPRYLEPSLEPPNQPSPRRHEGHEGQRTTGENNNTNSWLKFSGLFLRVLRAFVVKVGHVGAFRQSRCHPRAERGIGSLMKVSIEPHSHAPADPSLGSG